MKLLNYLEEARKHNWTVVQVHVPALESVERLLQEWHDAKLVRYPDAYVEGKQDQLEICFQELREIV